jgi:hypothetical protein
MKITRQTDLLLNVISPLLLGYLIYFLGSYELLPQWLKNYFPDGLWAYAFLSAILIIWNRQLNYVWLFISFLLAAVFELLQHYHLLAGTADVADIMTYFLFMGAGLFSNRFLKQKKHTQTV